VLSAHEDTALLAVGPATCYSRTGANSSSVCPRMCERIYVTFIWFAYKRPVRQLRRWPVSEI